jgi:hypothetical protein
MTIATPKLLQLQHVAHDEVSAPRPRFETPFIDFDLERSFESRQRHRLLISARHLVALFDYPADRGRLH